MTGAPKPREMWNYRCDQCFCETPVFSDNNLCIYCDPESSARIDAEEAKFFAEESAK
jgi:hypothetical protein